MFRTVADSASLGAQQSRRVLEHSFNIVEFEVDNMEFAVRAGVGQCCAHQVVSVLAACDAIQSERYAHAR